MMWQWSASVIAEVAASVILLLLAIYFPWRDLNRQARLTGVTLVFVCALWILSHAVEIGLPVVSYKEVLVGLQLVLGIIALTFWLFYIFHYLGPRKLLTRRIYILFGIMPVIAILALSTNNMYGLMWTASGLDSQNPYLPLQPTYSIIYWVCMVYVAMLTLTGSFLLIWNIVRRRYSYRRESVYLLIAAIIPLVTAFIEVMGLLSFLKLSVGLSSWTACIGAIILIFNLPKLRSEQVIPVARDIVFEQIGDCILVLDMQNRVMDLNPAAEQLTGYTISDAFGLSIERIWPYHSSPMISINKMAEAGEELILERDGKQRVYELHISTITDPGGSLTSKVVLLTDITGRKLADEKMERLHQQNELILSTVAEGIIGLDLQGNHTFVNPAAAKMLGYEVGELLFRPSHSTWHHTRADGSPYPQEACKIYAAFRTGVMHHVYNEVFWRKDGASFPVEYTSTPIYEQSGLVGAVVTFTDITERKQKDAALKASEAQHRLLAEHMANTVWLMDMNLKTTYDSPSAEKITGFTREDIMELPLEKRLTPESLKLAAEVFLEEIPRVIANPDYNPVIELELEIYRKDGTTLWTENKFSIIRDGCEKPVSILGESRDITERRQAERKIRESEILYRSLIETSPDAMGLMDLNGNIIMYNNQALDVFGFDVTEDLRGKNIMDFVAPEYYEASIKNAEKLRESEVIRNWEVISHKKDGRSFWVDINTSMLFDEERKPQSIMAVFRDITGRKLAEEKLEKSYESLKKTLNDAIDTMAKIVETRDPYTAGHQHKVADLANAIAREMKLGDTQIDQLRMAAVIHDIGKMYVPSDILSKPGRLSDIEFSLIKTHPQSGYDIVKGMDFPCNVANAVLQHHERLDGSGYPNQLKGEDTLLEAKILAVADVIEAMASHRPYRAALGIDKALEEISKNKGKFYDPGVVDACVNLFREKGYKLVE